MPRLCPHCSVPYPRGEGWGPCIDCQKAKAAEAAKKNPMRRVATPNPAILKRMNRLKAKAEEVRLYTCHHCRDIGFVLEETTDEKYGYTVLLSMRCPDKSHHREAPQAEPKWNNPW